jgi:GntR family transcriptional regulator, arabinose operon transcriptional repressor
MTEDSRISLHRRLTSRLGADIAAGRLRPGARLPSEKQLGEQFGISRGTVRQGLAALREQGLIEAIAGRGSFVRGLDPVEPTGRRRAIGVLVPSVARPYVASTLAGIEGALHDAGYSLLLASSGSRHEQQDGRLRRLLDEGVSGLIVYPLDYDPDPAVFARLVERSFPVVLIDRYLPGLDVDAVTPDNVGGAFAAVSHLAELGYRRIGFICTDNVTTTSIQERRQGYEQALRAAGLEVDESLILDSLPVVASMPMAPVGHADPSEQNIEMVKQFLDRPGRPTAVFALHDSIAVQVFAAASALSLRVPDDLAVVGFDDGPVAANHIVPITSVAQPFERIGRIAAELLCDRLDRARTESARVVLPTHLVLRRTSAARPPAEEDTA